MSDSPEEPKSPGQTIGPATIPSRFRIGGPAVLHDQRFPAAEVCAEAYLILEPAIKAYGLTEDWTVETLWKCWLDHGSWYAEVDFLAASLKHCEWLIRRLASGGRDVEAAAFAKAFVELEKLKVRDENRGTDLITRQRSTVDSDSLNHESLLNSIRKRRDNISTEVWGRRQTPRLARSSICQLMALRRRGLPLESRMSLKLATAIEKAIELDALQLGLITKTRSD